MADENREPAADLRHDLLREGHAFSFFQAMRLLRLITGGAQDQIAVRPALALDFPAADIREITASGDDSESFRITATFLGLYGVSSPLPTFYTEDLLDEAAEDESSTRDFLDLIHTRLYHLLYGCWLKYRTFLALVEEQDLPQLERLFCLIGLGEAPLRQDLDKPLRLLRYAGLLSQSPRSALGLETMLSDALTGLKVRVLPCRETRALIPTDQRLRLGIAGATLGGDAFLGMEIADRMGALRLSIGPLKRADFQRLLPGAPDHATLMQLTRLYLSDPLDFDLELVLGEDQLQTCCLGEPLWSRLGLDTWIFSGAHAPSSRAVFAPDAVISGSG